MIGINELLPSSGKTHTIFCAGGSDPKMNIGGIKMKKLFSLLLMTLALIACIAPGALAALQDDASCAHHLHSADCGGLASGGGACSFVCEDCRDMLQGKAFRAFRAGIWRLPCWQGRRLAIR